jgi:hypothetical protein
MGVACNEDFIRATEVIQTVSVLKLHVEKIRQKEGFFGAFIITSDS